MLRHLLLSRGAKPPARRRYRPTIESLEERDLLSAGYSAVGLLSDIPGLARFTDSNLTNPWGISADATDAFWFSDAHAGVSTLADGSGNTAYQGPPLVVGIPGPGSGALQSTPTGTVANPSFGFDIARNGRSGPSFFLFASLEGTISGWN